MKRLAVLGMGCLCVSCATHPKLEIDVRLPEGQERELCICPAVVHLAYVRNGTSFYVPYRDAWVERSALKSGQLSLRIPDDLYERHVDVYVLKDGKVVDELNVEMDGKKKIRISEKGVTLEERIAK
ncbi:MAG: hypothetical protein J1E42_03685 [Akkermansiaceae bacterium]|nr:hypothetical protein [Akkermansiaceae bacterium]